MLRVRDEDAQTPKDKLGIYLDVRVDEYGVVLLLLPLQGSMLSW